MPHLSAALAFGHARRHQPCAPCRRLPPPPPVRLSPSSLKPAAAPGRCYARFLVERPTQACQSPMLDPCDNPKGAGGLHSPISHARASRADPLDRAWASAAYAISRRSGLHGREHTRSLCAPLDLDRASTRRGGVWRAPADWTVAASSAPTCFTATEDVRVQPTLAPPNHTWVAFV